MVTNVCRHQPTWRHQSPLIVCRHRPTGDTNPLLLFVGTDLQETLIPFVVCRHRPTRDIDPLYFFCLHKIFSAFFTSSFIGSALCLLFLLSLFLYQIFLLFLQLLPLSALCLLLLLSLFSFFFLLLSLLLHCAHYFFFLCLRFVLTPFSFSGSIFLNARSDLHQYIIVDPE
jgi:hypothetical protein